MVLRHGRGGQRLGIRLEMLEVEMKLKIEIKHIEIHTFNKNISTNKKLI